MDQSWLFHNSHDPYYRSPFGAASCHEPLTLRLTVRRTERPEQVSLKMWRDGHHGDRELPLRLWREEHHSLTYEVTFHAPDEPCLLWYCFAVRHYGRTFYYGNNHQVLGGIGAAYENDPAAYQITVHRAGAGTPHWLKDAIIYQIYVDRFYNGNDDGRIDHLPHGSLIHRYWDDIPFYVRDPKNGSIFAYDFFGGNLRGVVEKLPYLKELGVSLIYFNPIFESVSNHKYDTGDYKAIDPQFGDNALFAELCARAAELGMKVILDGVFSHTGADSRYFNIHGRYPELGAYQSTASPYHKWYRFSHWPDRYESWWGIGTLPNVNELEPSYIDFMLEGQDSVIRHWSRAGAKGWRLDVADELPDEFLRRLRKALKKTDPEAILIGEVWEDASRKESYGQRRHYLLGDELDAVTGYPFRNLALDFALGRQDAAEVHARLMSLYENYPKETFYASMNMLGSHDVPRALTLLGEAPPAERMSVSDQARYRLPADKRRLAVDRLKLLALFQMTFPGAPCIYYGDEAGMEGYTDPFNRGTYPWGREETELLDWYRKVTGLRQHHAVLRTGDWRPLVTDGDVYGYIRHIGRGRDSFGRPQRPNTAIVLLNRSPGEVRRLSLDIGGYVDGEAFNALSDYQPVLVKNGRLEIILGPLSGACLVKRREEPPLFERAAGVLLHPTSLPDGDLGPGAYRFIDWLEAAGQGWWQVLPLNPPGYGDSPYQSASAFAGSERLISLALLVESGLLQEEDLGGDREELLRRAYAVFEPTEDYRAFKDENPIWLENYALFMALKGHFAGAPWPEWEEGAARRDPAVLAEYREKLAGEIDYYIFLQYQFNCQWQALKAYANARGVNILGDLPIFIAADSAATWGSPELFRLDAAGWPVAVAGVPPDYFSATGQLWGNPLYDWPAMAAGDYYWWQERLRNAFRLFDAVRIDHFRGFEAYWAVPAGEETAERGQWVAGPGPAFFSVVEKQLGRLPVVAEDLGIITPAVEALRDKFHYPGMKVLQFAVEPGGDGQASWPDGEDNAVVYTGTHDNDTTAGWFAHCRSERPDIVGRFPELAGATDAEVAWHFIEMAYAAAASLAIVPLQDILGLGSEARMNIPGTVGGNWNWRLTEELSVELAEKLAALVVKHRRK
jgi:4-alpha-glucanotransferase/glycosidase